METLIFRTTLVIRITPHTQIFPCPSPLLMFSSKNVFTIEKKGRILPKLLIFPLKKKSKKGGRSGKNLIIGGHLYGPYGSKNEGFHNGRNFWGHILTEHSVLCLVKYFAGTPILSVTKYRNFLVAQLVGEKLEGTSINDVYY